MSPLTGSSSFSMKTALVLPFIYVSLSAAQTDGVFYNPPSPGMASDFTENPTYQIGSTVQLRWSITWQQVSLILSQNGNPDYEFLLPNVTNTNNYNWIVSTSQNTSNGNVFSLSIYDPGTHDSFMSHYFNLTEASEAPSPTTLSSSVLGATTTAAVTMTPEMVIPATLSSAMAATNSLPPAVASSDPVSLSSTNGSGGSHHNYTGDSGNGDNNGLDSITKIGIGVGVGVGIPLFIALGITVGWMLRSTYKKRKASGHPYRWRLPWMSVEKNKANQKIPISPPMPLSVQELAGPQFIYELPTGVTPRSTIVPVLIPADRSSRATHKSHKSTSQHQSALQHQSTSSYYFDPAVIRGSITSYKF